MIRQLRIDDRLVHGEVVTLWVSNLGADCIVIANDMYATNPMMKMTATLVKPKNVAMEILTINDAINYCNTKRETKDKVFVVCGNVQDALKLVEGCDGITEINVGAVRHSEGKKQVNLKVFLDDKDVEDLNTMKNLGRTIFQQTKPDQGRVSLQEMLNKL